MHGTVPSDYDIEPYTANRDDYDYEHDIYRKIYDFSTDLNLYMQIFTILVNFFHFFVLTRKEMRSSAIYIIMTGISVIDIIFTLLEVYFVLVENNFLHNFFPIPYEECLRYDYTEISPGYTVLVLIKETTRRVSAWLAVAMALIRTLSVLFPMSAWAQKMIKPRAAVKTVMGIVLVFFGYASWPCFVFRVFWLPDNLNEYCKAHPRSTMRPRYLLAFPESVGLFTSRFGYIEAIMKFTPALIYPFFTVLLVLQLRSIKKRRQNVKKEGDNTTKLILFMTCAFMLSEGLCGVVDVCQFNIKALMAWNENLSYWILTAQYPIYNIKTLNAMSHCFVCYLMSSQYRGVVNSRFCRNSKRKTQKVIKMEERTASVNSLRSGTSLGSRKRRF